MKYRKFGNTDLRVSEISFGAWAIGGPAMAGNIPIGWGKIDDKQSKLALYKAMDRGINFYDTADFYGFGHSEKVIGAAFGNRQDVIIATKVGQRIDDEKKIFTDYTYDYIIHACEESLRRLDRECIDFYQLHTARIDDLEKSECFEAMQTLKRQGKIRYWGLSLNTYHPDPEANFMMNKLVGDGFQLVLNMINQRAVETINKAGKLGYGLIARMPLQFGLLTGKFNKLTRFSGQDHRSNRLTPDILEKSLEALDSVWPLADKCKITKTALSLSFILSFHEISTVIPGMKTVEQVINNTTGIVPLAHEDLEKIKEIYFQEYTPIVELMEKEG